MDQGNSKRGMKGLPKSRVSNVKSGGKIKNPRPSGSKKK